MTETITIDCPPVAGAKPAKLNERREKATVSASALAVHLDCVRQYIGKLEAEGVFHRAPDGSFLLDASRLAYIRRLRRERKQSPRSEADADFQRAKAELIRLRIAEKQRALIPLAEAIETTDKIIGIVLVHMGSMPARIAGQDLAARRKIEKIIFEVRTEISEAASKLADQRGEPPEPEETGE